MFSPQKKTSQRWSTKAGINGVHGNLLKRLKSFVSVFNNSDHQIQSKLLPCSGWTWGKRIHFSFCNIPKKLDCQPISVQVCGQPHLHQASEHPMTIENPWFVYQWRSNGHWMALSVGERNVLSHVPLHQTNQLCDPGSPCLCQYTWVGHGLEEGI